MNIVLLHYTAPPEVGGVETALARQAQLLARAGHQVRVVTGRGEAWNARIPVEVLPLLDYRHPQVLRVKAALDEGQVPEEFQPLVDSIQSRLVSAIEGADVVIAHNIASMHHNLAFTAALYEIFQHEGSPRLILWHHDLAWTIPRYQREIHPGWPWSLLSELWPGARHVAVSPVRREQLSDLTGLPLWEITVIPSGLDLADFLNLPPRVVALFDQLDLTLAAPILLAPVRITRRKNLELAIGALAELRKSMPEAVLVVTGPCSQSALGRQYFEQLKKQRKQLGLEGAVHLLSEIATEGLPDESVAGFFRLSDALLLTSRDEGFGMPVLEAGLARLPIFCSGLPSLRALALDWATYFSPVDDPAHVADLIYKRLHNDPQYQMRVRVRRDYTWKAVYQNKVEPLLE